MKIKKVELTPTKTYKTAANAEKAVMDKYGNVQLTWNLGPLRYMIVQHTDGRFFPVFIGESAIRYGAHQHFSIVG
jgi:hypothetical protein